MIQTVKIKARFHRYQIDCSLCVKLVNNDTRRGSTGGGKVMLKGVCVCGLPDYPTAPTGSRERTVLILESRSDVCIK